MFTSEPLTRVRAALAPHLRFIAFLAVAFAVTLVVVARFLADWTAQTNHRVQAVQSLGPNIKVLVTGSSHVFATINPALVQPPTMNLAAPVCSYVCVEGIVHGNLHKVPGLEALVIEYDVVPLFYDTLRAYQSDYRQLLDLDPDLAVMDVSAWQRYELWRDRTLDRSWLGPLLRFGKPTPKEVLERMRGGQAIEDAVTAPGYANGPEIMPVDDDGPARVARHRRESGGLSELPRNEAALRRLIQLSLSRGLKLALMRFPHHPGYWRALPEEWRRTEQELLVRLERDLPGAFVFWDFGELPSLAESDYRNGDHINDGATAEVTALFQERLALLMNGERSAAARGGSSHGGE